MMICNNPVVIILATVVIVLIGYCREISLAAQLLSDTTHLADYVYKYETQVRTGAGDGFRLKARAYLEILQSDQNEQTGFAIWLVPQRLSHIFKPDHKLYATIEVEEIVHNKTSSQTIKSLYSHKQDSTFFKNIKKSILSNLLISTSKHADHLTSEETSTLSPQSSSEVSLWVSQIEVDDISRAKRIIIPNNRVDGSQNVTFNSRVTTSKANVTTTFRLKLLDIKPNKDHKFIHESLSSRLENLVNHEHYEVDSAELKREVKQCTSNQQSCKEQSIGKLIKELTTRGSIEGSVAFLVLLDKLRMAGEKVEAKDIVATLKTIDPGSRSAFLNVLAAAKTQATIEGALNYLQLAIIDKPDDAERFLTVLSIATQTYYATSNDDQNKTLIELDGDARRQRAPRMSSQLIAMKLLDYLNQWPRDSWRSHKLRWSTLLTLGSLIRANSMQEADSSLAQKVLSLLENELDACDLEDEPTDCRVVMLRAMGNAAHLADKQFAVLEAQIIGSGRRESVTGMQVLRDILASNGKPLINNKTLQVRLKNLVMRVAYDSSMDSSARVIAAEIMVRFLPNSSSLTKQLIEQLPSFANRELATMIQSKIVSSMKLTTNSTNEQFHTNNWYWKSSLINGLSGSFVDQIATSDSLDASYAINYELIDGQMTSLKAGSMDIYLATRELFSVELFARGMAKLHGESATEDHLQVNDSPEDDQESFEVGINLKVLNQNLRPLVLLSSTFELYSHLFWGTAENEMTIFGGDVLLIDRDIGVPLVSGFVVEQQMRAILSIDVTGKLVASSMTEAHYLVRAKAAIIAQGSQSVFTSYDNLWLSELFSFGGETQVDFVGDAILKSSNSYKNCLRVTQPNFLIRFNSRRRHRLMGEKVTRKFRKQNHHIAAKSYPLFSKNNQMCSAMFHSNELPPYDHKDPN